MSHYFNQRIKNIPVVDANRQNRSTSDKNSDSVITLSDDELLESVLEFEKTDEFKKVQQSVASKTETENNNKRIHPFFENSKSSPTKPNKETLANSKTAKPIDKDRMKQEITEMISSTRKRPAADLSDDEIVPVGSMPSPIVRKPIKRLPQSKPDFHSFLPKNQTIAERTKTLLNNFSARGYKPESLETNLINAREQLKLREALMRKPKQTTNIEKPVEKKVKVDEVKKRKNDETEIDPPKKTKTGQKNAFEKLLHETTESFHRVGLMIANSSSVSSPTTSNASIPLPDINTMSSSSTVSSTLPVHSKSNKILAGKNLKRRKILTFDDYVIYILKWPTNLIEETEFEKNILYKEFLGDIDHPLQVLELYGSFDEYEEITFPWLLEETFEEIKRSVKMHDHKLWRTTFQGVVSQVNIAPSGLHKVKTQMLYKRGLPIEQRPDMFCEEDLVLLTLDQPEKKKVFGLIQSGERITDRNYLHKTFIDHPDVKIRPPVWSCQELNIRIFGENMKIPDGGQIKVQAIASLTSTLRRFKALSSMRSCPLFQYLLSPSINESVFQLPTKDDRILEEKYFQVYNQSQRQVISEAVSMVLGTKEDEPGRVYMCQGPPGTGKSQTITGIIRALLQPIIAATSVEQSPTVSSSNKDKKLKILICCPSNGGCNEIVRRLIDVFGRKPGNNSNEEKKEAKLPFNLVRCARGGGVSEDIESVSLDILAQKRLQEELNSGGQNEAIKRNLANKEKQKEQLIQRIELEKKKQNVNGNQNNSEELKDLELNLKEITASINKFRQTAMKTISESARKKREREIKIELLQEADICVSTLNYVGNTLFDSFSPFDPTKVVNKTDMTNIKSDSKIASLFNCLIIDEAGQCIEIDCFIPLRLGMNRVILVGDPEQLPATVLSRQALDAGLNQSLFERLYRLFKYDVNNPIRMLNIQYRMHEEICKFPSMHIYRSKLKTDKEINQKRKRFLLKPYMILDAVHSQEQLDPTTQSYGNPLEAEMLVSLVEFINEHAKVPFNQIGIITPYSYQLKLIEQQLMRRNLSQQKIEIGTVDAFQGRQKDVILLSCVRATLPAEQTSTSSTSIGFVANRQRLNVSLTRAKYAMYIIGHMNSLISNEDWNKLYKNAIERKTILQLTSPEIFAALMKRQAEASNRPVEMN